MMLCRYDNGVTGGVVAMVSALLLVAQCEMVDI